jgi:hypothetical protein
MTRGAVRAIISSQQAVEGSEGLINSLMKAFTLINEAQLC